MNAPLGTLAIKLLATVTVLVVLFIADIIPISTTLDEFILKPPEAVVDT